MCFILHFVFSFCTEFKGRQCFASNSVLISFLIWIIYLSLLELRNVSFFYTVQILHQEKLVNRNNFGLYLNRTKLSKKIILKNKCWQLYQIRLVYTRKYFISCANLPKKAWFCKNVCSHKLFAPTYTRIYPWDFATVVYICLLYWCFICL